MIHLHTQQVFHLCGEDSDGDTAGETYHDGVGNILDNGSQTQHAQHDEEYTSHQRGDGQSLDAILLDDTVDDDDEGTCRSSNLYLTTTK